MAQDVTLFQGQVPAHLVNSAAAQQAAERNAQALAGAGGGGVDRISLKQSRFRIIEGGEEVAKLDASSLNLVVLRVNPGISKNYYEKAWNPNDEPEAPTCYSDDGVVPSPNADKPQAQTCAECPHNAWGSRINPNTGAEGKACADSKRLAVMGAGDLLKEKGKVYQLSIPAASLKDWGKYMRQLNALNPPVPYNALVTAVSFDTDASFPKLEFAPVRYLSEEEFNTAEGKYESEPIKLSAGLAEAAAAHARQRAAGTNIPGQNPAAAAQQAVREQGQAQADTLGQAQAQAQPQAQAPDKGQQAVQQPEVATPPTNDAPADSFGSDPAPVGTQAAGQAQAEAPPASDNADSFGAEAPAQQPQGSQPAQQPDASADSFGSEPAAQPQTQQHQPAEGFGEPDPQQAQQPQQQQEQPEQAKGNSLDSVFGAGWDDD